MSRPPEAPEPSSAEPIADGDFFDPPEPEPRPEPTEPAERAAPEPPRAEQAVEEPDAEPAVDLEGPRRRARRERAERREAQQRAMAIEQARREERQKVLQQYWADRTGSLPGPPAVSRASWPDLLYPAGQYGGLWFAPRQAQDPSLAEPPR